MKARFLMSCIALMYSVGQQNESAGGGAAPNPGPAAAPELSFGQKLVGLNFNHAEGAVHEAVHKAKQLSADGIDQLNDFRNRPDASPEQKRLASAAITHIQTSQMWAVKALTWKD